ncbi:hypothetical protein [Thalassotalea agarivorans]|uniref:Transcriptional regulator VspR n=1 Tax=Thalassotalea agarivorans TaxID=349064 RepID=A0A1H9ZID5_THASX|nr:hypothetical protein [Thalassotalea agarivorans]SES81358.1 hypothetical protein SAMN05660429_00461 [Thalassotalea agarivorans]
MKIDSLLKQIICMKNINRFSVTEIRTAYLALMCDEELDSQKVRQFIYDDLHKLVKQGWLIKKTASNGKESRFTKTEVFDPAIIAEEIKQSVKEPNRKLSETIKSLYSDLSMLNADLLQCMGALDSFLNLKQQHPELSDEFKEFIHSTKEQKHILKGKIAATEEILKKLKEKK